MTGLQPIPVLSGKEGKAFEDQYLKNNTKLADISEIEQKLIEEQKLLPIEKCLEIIESVNFRPLTSSEERYTNIVRSAKLSTWGTHIIETMNRIAFE